MIFIFPKNYQFKNKLLGFIDYSSFFFFICWCLFIYFILQFFLFTINIKIFLFIIFCFPIFIFSIVGFNHENFLYVLMYFIKFHSNRGIYLYKK